MAFFTNYATLSYQGGTQVSNTVTGELLDVVSVVKTALAEQYAPGDTLAYAVTILNRGTTPVSGLTLTDDLGAYQLNGVTVYPLNYREGSLRYLVNGVAQPLPAVPMADTLQIPGLEIPAGGQATLLYQADVTNMAPLGAESAIDNTATLSGGALAQSRSASAQVPAAEGAVLRLSKAVSPAVVMPDETLTYTFTLENLGPAASPADLVLADSFQPPLQGLSVSFNGTPWTQGVNYSYDPATGAFATLAGQLSVPAAVYTQGTDGSWTVQPGLSALSVSGMLGT